MEATGTSTTLAALAVVALAMAMGCLVRLHRLAPEVSPIRDAVSDYGAGPHAVWYRAQVVLVGSATIATWGGLLAASFDGDGTAWLLVFAISRISISAFPVDLSEAEPTPRGRIHTVLAATAFASIAIAATTVGRTLLDQPGWAFHAWWYRASGTLVAATAIALALTWLVPRVRHAAFGAVERCWYAAMLLWLTLTALGLLVTQGSG